MFHNIEARDAYASVLNYVIADLDNDLSPVRN